MIAEELKDFPGVSKINVDHKAGVANLLLDESQSSLDAILDAISKAGYTATVKSKGKNKKEKTFKKVTIFEEKSNGNIFNPIRVVYSSQLAAEGNISENEKGILQVDGSFNKTQNTEFIIPDGKEDESIGYIQKFMHTVGKVDIAEPQLVEPATNGVKHFETPLVAAKVDEPNATILKQEISEVKRIQLSLSGMHCSSCAGLIERGLKKVPGVKEVGVNFAAEKASVLFDESVSPKQKLIEAVEKTGYKAEFADQKDGESETKKRQADIKHLFNKFSRSFVLSAPMIYFMLMDFFKWIPGTSTLLPYVGIVSLIFHTLRLLFSSFKSQGSLISPLKILLQKSQ